MPSHAPKLAPVRKCPRVSGEDPGVALDAEALEYIYEEEEHERRVRPGSPAPVFVNNDGTKGTLLQLLMTLLPIALLNDRPIFGDVNLDTYGLLKVPPMMLAAVERVTKADKYGFSSSNSNDTPLVTPSRANRKNKMNKLSTEYHTFINNLPLYPGFLGGVTNLYCACSVGLKQ